MIRAALALLLLTLPAWAADLSGPATIVDGDTIEVRGQRIRLWGVDAPEMNTDAGKDAARHLALALRGRDVSCVDTGGRTWGRIVARCEADGRGDIAMMLVCAGHAVDWQRYSRGAYATCRK